ncbi:exodeoxyribonuclease III [Solicola sp. PLA-1-18]|uniref:exodeoxyribonuclease III n=1 Tax=Solicola sp. PLA-1-18 TaxID=3380532 RepID=UPI003B7857A9
MLRVASVNVNGIRAAFRRGMDGWLASRDVDVLALQEVRAPTEVLTEHLEPLGWHVAHDLADAAGRAGVAVATRSEPLAVRHGVEADEFSGAGRWVEVDVPTADGGHLTVVSAYVHTGQADDPRQDVKHRFLDAALDRLAKLHADGRPAVLTGDLNVAHTHLDIKNWKGNRGKSGFLPSEQAYLDRLAGELGWVDVARAAAGEVPGPYTWWSWRGQAFDNDSGWRIDYQWASPSLAAVARDCVVDRAPTYAERFSDHAPLVVDYLL